MKIMDQMDLNHTLDVPDTPNRITNWGIKGNRSVTEENLGLSTPGHGQQQFLEGTKDQPLIIDSGSRGSSLQPQERSSSSGNTNLFRKRMSENPHHISLSSIQAQQLPSLKSSFITKSSSYQNDSSVDLRGRNLGRPGKTSSRRMPKDNHAEFPKRSESTNGTLLSHGTEKFSNGSCSSEETDSAIGVGSSIEHREGVEFVGSLQNEPANGSFVPLNSIAQPKVNKQKRLVRNGCISPNNIAKAKQLSGKSINGPEDAAHSNRCTVASTSPFNSIDVGDLIAEDNGFHPRNGKGVMIHPYSSNRNDIGNKNMYCRNFTGSHGKAMENGDCITQAGKSFQEPGGWRCTRKRARGMSTSPSADKEQHSVRNADYLRQPNQHKDYGLERKENRTSFSVGNGHPEDQNLVSPEHVSSQPLTISVPHPRVGLGQTKGPLSTAGSLIKRQKQGSVSNSSGECSTAVSNGLDIVCLSSPGEASNPKYHSGKNNSHSIIEVDDLSPQLRCNARDEDARARQVEADERLAHELQEQLYNEVPVFGVGEVDEHMSLGLQQQDDPNHDFSQRGSLPNFPRQSQFRSSSNVPRRAPLPRRSRLGRMTRLRSRLAGQPRTGLPSGRTSLFPPDMNIDMRMRILEALEELSDVADVLETQHDFDENDYEMLLTLDENNDQHGGASTSQINSLPLSTVQSASVGEACAICLETPTIGDMIRHLPCFHKFHQNCIDEWLRRRTSCPVCKSSIT